MEAASEGEKRKPLEGGEIKTKRKMKTASQLELLEKTYAVETYPLETLRAELSEKLGLTDRQLQMWFCHRRLKDRKVAPAKRPRKDGSAVVSTAGVGDDIEVVELGNEHESGSGSGSSSFCHREPRKAVARTLATAVSRIGAEVPIMKRYYEPSQSMSELRAIAFVEAQLGELPREDGPILGMEFDPLPPDAFGAPIATVGQQKQAGRAYEGKVYERRDAKSVKPSSLVSNKEHCFVTNSAGGKGKLTVGSVHAVHLQAAARALHEYQFLPEQPSVRSDTYERVARSHLYDSPFDVPGTRNSLLSSGGPFMHGNEQFPTGYGLQGQVSSISLLSQQGRQSQTFSFASAEYEVPPRSSFTSIGMDSQYGSHPIIGLENSFGSSERCVSHDVDVSRMETKRKSEEERIASEVEAHEERIRKELERQDILRQKRREQMRKEMERHDRERRKEEERLLREKQREEERFQREQKREMKRREKILQKESLRAEKMRRKEELRKEKEAAKLKAANERATARRIAKESMELIEDERLELMELAASSKGLPSIISLDSATLQNLGLFRDMLSTFPPMSVPSKRPFSIEPWITSEENVGSLLMVWRFLITFADVLGLWPFTLDEFVQAFHDYDPRLLGEIHVSLLRIIIKDIEDVARTPLIVLGVNQNSAANPVGGHPQIVKGAYSWGFDIRSWQRHLNPLTWPEILRQFSLSAGFGPQLKKSNIERAYFRDENEGNDGEAVVYTLRNGAAAENAAAMMQEKGFSYPRRSRNRLTPGTVKFAAFHVLSLEGSKGLTILEVAEKIQKSGLRDLTTSKTPEASIAAALSRDSNIFERTAPSTYCVRPAYRKDPSDAEAILSAAREKIQIFETGYSDGEDADDVERKEDSECEASEDPELDNIGTKSNPNKEPWNSNEESTAQAMSSSGNGKDALCDELQTTQTGPGSTCKIFSSYLMDGSKELNSSGATIDQSVYVGGNCKETGILDQEDADIDESNSGETWVLGLMEGEYSDLCVEERLNALVALIGVTIEGNTIRIVLQERLEAANSLKKQMWAEAHLDKRRMKEEHTTKLQYSSVMESKGEQHITASGVEGNQSPLLLLDNKLDESSPNPAVKNESFLDQPNKFSSERSFIAQDFSTSIDNFPLQQQGYAAEKSRSQLKYYIGHKAEEMYVYRSLPLGQDRRRNWYWQFVTSTSTNDPGSGRIFIELHDGCWRLIDSEEAFDALLASLDTRGIREAHLHSMLQKIETSFKGTVKRNLETKVISPSVAVVKTEAIRIDSSTDFNADIDSPSSTVCRSNADTLDSLSSFRIELGRNEREKFGALKRYRDFEMWMWKECFHPSVLCAMKYGKKRCKQLLGICDFCQDSYFSEYNHCPSCHGSFGTLDNHLNFSEHVMQCEKKQVGPDRNANISNSLFPLRIRLLKAQLALIEASIPAEALQPLWTELYRNSWGLTLHTSSSAEHLLQILTILERIIRRDFLSSDFETSQELLGSSSLSKNGENDSSFPKPVPVLTWVPQTTAAVALRLIELDASISYMPQQKVESHKEGDAGEYIKLPSRYAFVKNIQEAEAAETPDQALFVQQEDCIDPGGRRYSSGRGRGDRGRGRGRTRGGRLQRGISGPRFESGKQNLGNRDRMDHRLEEKVRTRGRGQRRGRRTIRNRPRPEKRNVEETALNRFSDISIPKTMSVEDSPRSSGRERWDSQETLKIQVHGADDNNCAEMSDYDDNGQATGDEYEDQVGGYHSGFNDKLDLMESDDEVDGDGDKDDEGDGNGNVGTPSEDEDENGNEDEGTASGSESSEYSD